MAIYIYDGSILAPGSPGIATSEDCCCDTACYLLRPCDDLTNTCFGCDPALPDTLYITLSGLGGALSYMNGTHAVPYSALCYWVSTAADTISIHYETAFGLNKWVLFIGTSTSCRITLHGGSNQCTPNDTTFTVNSCTDTRCSGMCAASTGATATVAFTEASMTPGANDIVVDDNLSAYSPGDVIGYNNTCYVILGEITCPATPVTMGSWDDFTDCDDCSAPCSCPSGLTGDYRIAGYTDGDLTGCTSCWDVGTTFAWDGSFTYTSACLWNGGSGPVDGRYTYTDPPELKLDTSGSPDCVWRLTVWCWDETTTNRYVIWEGTKATGQDPTGTYYRVSGCDTTTSVVIEAVP